MTIWKMIPDKARGYITQNPDLHVPRLNPTGRRVGTRSQRTGEDEITKQCDEIQGIGGGENPTMSERVITPCYVFEYRD
jgi:hypothetical protein